MMPMKLRRPLAALSLFGALGASSLLAQEWPIAKRDTFRSGYATGEGEIVEPVVLARMKVGTTADARASLTLDLDGDGIREVLYVDSDRAIARDLRDRLYWASVSLGLVELQGVYDFDGDGNLEVLALGNDGLAILDVRDGSLLWHKTGFQTNNNVTNDRNTKIADLNGDGLPDIVVKAHNFSDGKAHAYTFKDGYFEAANGNEMWAYTIVDTSNGAIYPTLTDVDADGKLDVILVGYSGVEILEGSTGVRKYLLPAPSGLYQNAGPVVTAQLDTDPQIEVLHFVTPNFGAGIEVMDLVKFPSRMAAYEAYPTTYRVSAGLDSVRDLDDDGVPEILFNRWNGSRWQTVIMRYQESSGQGGPSASLTTLATIDDTFTAGIRDLDGEAPLEIVTLPALAGAVDLPLLAGATVHHFTGNGLSAVFSYPNAVVHTAYATPVVSSENSFLAVPPLQTLDVDGDGRGDLLLNIDEDGDKRAEALIAISSQGEELARFVFPNPGALGILETTPDLTGEGAGPQLMVLHNGQIMVLGADLRQLAAISGAGVVIDSQVVDLFGDGFNETLYQAVNAEFQVVSGESIVGPSVTPTSEWAYLADSRQEALVVDIEGDGEKELIFRDYRTRGKTIFLVYASDGTQIDTFQIDVVISDFTPGDFNNDGIVDFVGTYSLAPEYRAILFDGGTFAPIWEKAVPAPQGQRPTAQRTVVVDVNADSTPDYCLAMNEYYGCMNGLNGNSLSVVKSGTFGGGPLITQADADADLDLILVNERTISKYTLAMGVEWSISQAAGESSAWVNGTFVMKGTVGDANDDGRAEIFVAAADNRLYCFNADSSTAWIRYLKAGAVSRYVDDYKSSIFLGREALADIDGDGDLDVIVGSSDGYLYAVDALSGERVWALPFLFKVGNPVVADADGDGMLEVVVSVGDSYLQIVDDAVMAAPAEVKDVALKGDGSADATGPDVDESEASDRLGASWSAVEGADGYMAAVISPSGYYVVPWTDMGNVTSAVFVDSHFVYGNTYVVAVQAWNGLGAGAVGRSDGVRIVDLTAPRIDGFIADPAAFNPERDTSLISATLRDATELFSYSFSITGQGETLFSESRTIGGTSFDIDHEFTGRDEEGALLADGPYTAAIQVRDVQGRQASASLDVVIDTLPPEPPDIVTPQDGALLAMGSVTLSGMAEPGLLIEVSVLNASGGDCTTTSNGQGAWACAPVTLSDGTWVALATATDAAGNVSDPSSVTFTLDTLSPDKPVILDPEDGAYLRERTVLFSGLTDPSTRVQVLVDGGSACVTELVGDDQVWECEGESSLEDGSYTAVAVATDLAGNESAPSDPVDFTIDTVPPGDPTITSPTEEEIVTTGRPLFEGEADPESTVLVDVDGQQVCTAIAGEERLWSCRSSLDLPEGERTARARARDRAGNLSGSFERHFLIDIETGDEDADGYTACGFEGAPAECDCDDEAAAVNPGVEEVVDDGIDNDCDGVIDELPPTATPTPEPPTVTPSPSPTPTEPETTAPSPTPTPSATPTPTAAPTTAPPPSATPTPATEPPTDVAPTAAPTSPAPEETSPPIVVDDDCGCASDGRTPAERGASLLLAVFLVGIGRRRRAQ